MQSFEFGTLGVHTLNIFLQAICNGIFNNPDQYNFEKVLAHKRKLL